MDAMWQHIATPPPGTCMCQVTIRPIPTNSPAIASNFWWALLRASRAARPVCSRPMRKRIAAARTPSCPHNHDAVDIFQKIEFQNQCIIKVMTRPVAATVELSPALAIVPQPAERLELRPPLKWAGGKRWLVPYLQPIWAEHTDRRLVEPFCGGLAVTLGLRPDRALLNDINPHLVNFYRLLQQSLQIEMPMRNSERAYYAARARFNRLLAEGKETTQEAAELFYYLNRTGYNGLCRFNQSGRFNVPFGRYRTIGYTRDFAHYAETLSGWRFSSRDFEALRLRPDDFIYADPPYDVEFTSYSKDGFDWDDQVRLARWLADHRGPVVLSNQATDRIVKLYRGLGFRLHFLHAPRLINCTGDRTPAKEVLAMKNL
jgi:DNA adenine methylase